MLGPHEIVGSLTTGTPTVHNTRVRFASYSPWLVLRGYDLNLLLYCSCAGSSLPTTIHTPKPVRRFGASHEPNQKPVLGTFPDRSGPVKMFDLTTSERYIRFNQRERERERERPRERERERRYRQPCQYSAGVETFSPRSARHN